MQNLLLRNACAHKTQGLSQRIEIKYGIYTKKSRKCGNKKVRKYRANRNKSKCSKLNHDMPSTMFDLNKLYHCLSNDYLVNKKQ